MIYLFIYLFIHIHLLYAILRHVFVFEYIEGQSQLMIKMDLNTIHFNSDQIYLEQIY